MSFFDDPQDAAEAFDVVLTDRERQKQQAQDKWLLAELDAIGTDTENEAAPPQEEVKEKRAFTGSTFQAPDPDDEDVLFEPVKLTRYDKARKELCERKAKRDTILSKGELSAEDKKRLGVLRESIASAQKRFEKASERAKDDNARRQESIDEWRKTDEGKLIRNAQRRQKRDKPNNDLSGMTEDEKNRRKQDQKNDSKWRKSCEQKGWSQERIQAAFILRLEERQRKREGEAKVIDEQERLENRPDFGVF